MQIAMKCATRESTSYSSRRKIWLNREESPLTKNFRGA
jgi:hypothetical protein